MYLKWIGAAIVILGCGGFGFRLAFSHRQEEKNLRQFVSVLDYMECELEYRLTSLPNLCRQAAAISTGAIHSLFTALSQELESQVAPDAQYCMNAAISKTTGLSPLLQEQLNNLGKSLGRFDLPGQLRGLCAVRQECARVLEKLTENKDVRLRGYQTLGLCAGAALAILFL